MKRSLIIGIALLHIVVLSTTSCTKTQYEKDVEIIQQYIADNNIQAIELDQTGLYYSIEKQGGNLHPNYNSIVTVNYKGYLTDGTLFGSDDTVMLALDQTITGWQMGVPLIGEGGRIKLIIPSQYGYGTQGSGTTVPKNAILIFDIDLMLFNK